MIQKVRFSPSVNEQAARARSVKARVWLSCLLSPGYARWKQAQRKMAAHYLYHGPEFCLFDKRWEQMSSILCHWTENTAPEALFHFFSRVCHGRTLFLVLVLVLLLCMLQNIYSCKAALTFFIFLSFSAYFHSHIFKYKYCTL